MIRLDQPRRWDLVSDSIMLAGIGTGFEATINYRITEGHDEVSGYVMAGGGSGEHAQFQEKVNVAKASFKLDRVFVEVFEASAKDGSDLHKVSRAVLLGSRMVEGYYGYRLHTVKKGETLIKIAREHYGMDDWKPIQRANPEQPSYLKSYLFPGQVLRIPVGS